MPDLLQQKILLNHAEAAEVLGMSEVFLRTAIIELDIPVIRCGSRLLYSVDALKQWAFNKANETTVTTTKLKMRKRA